MSLTRTVSEINGNFSGKSQFSHPRVFNAPADGVPLGIGYCCTANKTRMMGLPDGQKSFKMGLAVWTQYRRVTEGRTDGRTDKQDRRTPHNGKDCAMQSVARVK